MEFHKNPSVQWEPNRRTDGQTFRNFANALKIFYMQGQCHSYMMADGLPVASVLYIPCKYFYVTETQIFLYCCFYSGWSR